MVKYSAFQSYALPVIFLIAPFLFIALFANGLASEAAGTHADIGLALIGANISGFVLIGAIAFAFPFLIASIAALIKFRHGKTHSAHTIQLVILVFLAVYYGFLSLTERANLPFAILPAAMAILTVFADRTDEKFFRKGIS